MFSLSFFCSLYRYCSCQFCLLPLVLFSLSSSASSFCSTYTRLVFINKPSLHVHKTPKLTLSCYAKEEKKPINSIAKENIHNFAHVQKKEQKNFTLTELTFFFFVRNDDIYIIYRCSNMFRVIATNHIHLVLFPFKDNLLLLAKKTMHLFFQIC